MTLQQVTSSIDNGAFAEVVAMVKTKQEICNVTQKTQDTLSIQKEKGK